MHFDVLLELSRGIFLGLDRNRVKEDVFSDPAAEQFTDLHQL